MLLKVIACEIALREICHAAARALNLVDLEFLMQGYHDTPAVGQAELQKRVDAAVDRNYDAILVGYGLCSNILAGLTARRVQLVIPRAHDCITFFLGSKERYTTLFAARPGTYYYTSGWLECPKRRSGALPEGFSGFVPAHVAAGMRIAYDQWLRKYGEEKARYLVEVMGRWTQHYTHGVLIEYDFTRQLGLREEVERICAQQGWQFEEIDGDIGFFDRWLNGQWDSSDFLVVPPGRKVVATYDEQIIGLDPAEPEPTESCIGATSYGDIKANR